MENSQRENNLVTIKVNNQSTITFNKKPVHHSQPKHIDAQYHFILNCVDDKKIFLNFVPSLHQIANVFYKTLRSIKFEVFQTLMGLRSFEDDVLDQGGDRRLMVLIKS